MNIKGETIIYPLPDIELLTEKEKKWRLTLPDSYKEFISHYNGGVPIQNSFIYNSKSYAITRFLCVLKNVKEEKFGWCDISVIESQIGERLTSNEDLVGIEVLPIAELFTGDYLCLDFRVNKLNPSVCIWDHEESGEFEPITYWIADSFDNFMKILTE
ncbi:SUKH superfamily protein [Mobilisporobacter senegalensis]|uniref:SUKH superfamily protein n=1 Tax=Mobilisporobacter senegalensis TaxID=1329262 RepID=A0A3N1Y2I2_9FIRM|nr:SMI1/KNR4 family protein [Mobilisporobacter senegalensis]ROR31752.1 SUKH superfamily protein [Mobilisporobacter senegalensis]